MDTKKLVEKIRERIESYENKMKIENSFIKKEIYDIRVDELRRTLSLITDLYFDELAEELQNFKKEEGEEKNAW